MNQLNYKPTSSCNDAGSHISGATGQSIGTATTEGNSLQSGSLANLALKLAKAEKENAELKSLELKLVNAESENAELKFKLNSMDLRVEQLTQLVMNQQTTPASNPTSHTSNVTFHANPSSDTAAEQRKEELCQELHKAQSEMKKSNREFNDARNKHRRKKAIVEKIKGVMVVDESQQSVESKKKGALQSSLLLPPTL